jgi:transcriptional regulator with XRE-family HTH domain
MDLLDFKDFVPIGPDDDVLISQRAIARSALRNRLDAGLTQAQLAQRARTTQARVSEIEALKGDPKLSTLARVAHALGFMIDMVKPAEHHVFAEASVFPASLRERGATSGSLSAAGTQDTKPWKPTLTGGVI